MNSGNFKNNPRKVIDVVQPKRQPFFANTSSAGKVKTTPIFRPTKGRLRFLFLLTGGALASGLTLYFFITALLFKNEATGSASFIESMFREAAKALAGLETKKATDYLKSVKNEAGELNKKAEVTGLSSLAEIGGVLFPTLKAFPQAIRSLADLSGAAFSLAERLDYLKQNALPFFTNRKGDLILAALKDILGNLENFEKSVNELSQQAATLKYPLNEEYLSVGINLKNGHDFMERFVRWLDSPQTKHLAIFFQNPSEIRPAGGFIGSYADVSIKKGSLANIDVRDIYDPDGQLDLKLIPPKPLQAITTRWQARDANWFFDFPTSAAKVLSLLEASKIYREQNLHFDGAIALNVEVLEDLLGVIGPIKMPEYKLTLTPENFLAKIQEEVETGADKKTIGQPKTILKKLTPILFEKLSQLTEEQKKKFFTAIQNRLENKDIMIFFKDTIMENYLKDLGVGGEVLKLANDFRGNYLAVVNANIGGGKSDEFIAQKIKLESVIDLTGRVNNTLTVTRAHKGQRQNEWWYRATNKNYLQIFTPYGAKLINSSGITERILPAPINYKAKGYSADGDVATIESSETQFGKTVFGQWFYVQPGQTKNLVLEYRNPARVPLGENPTPYKFIFEKQSGVDHPLEFTLDAPPGYKWLDSNSPTFEYSIENAPKRLELNLTLIPIK